MGKNKPLKVFGIIMGSILLIPAIYLFTIYLLFLRPNTDWVPFNSEQWKTGINYQSEDIRYRMHKNLIKKYKLLNMTKEEIVDILGPPTDTDYFRSWDMVYWMGNEPGVFGIDSAWLVLNLENNKVKEYKIVTD